MWREFIILWNTQEKVNKPKFSTHVVEFCPFLCHLIGLWWVCIGPEQEQDCLQFSTHHSSMKSSGAILETTYTHNADDKQADI